MLKIARRVGTRLVTVYILHFTKCNRRHNPIPTMVLKYCVNVYYGPSDGNLMPCGLRPGIPRTPGGTRELAPGPASRAATRYQVENRGGDDKKSLAAIDSMDSVPFVGTI